MTDFPIIISGAGPAGLATACSLAHEGIMVAVIAPHTQAPDPRTTALMQPAIQLLRHIGVWPGDLERQSAPLRQLHLVDDTGHLVSAPRVEFSARELQLPEFGWNVPLAALTPALQTRAEMLGVSFIAASCVSAKSGDGDITITTDTGQHLAAKLLVCADGAGSPTRKALGFATETRKFDQCALVTSFDHTADHEFVSTEWHKQDGPFTTVPLPGRRSSLVWMAKPARIAQLMALSDADFCIEVQLESHGMLGRITNPTPRKFFPMHLQRATMLAKSRAVLVGEAGHALPPIGAQGLNLSMRDAGTLADLVVAVADPGSAEVCAAYDQQRRVDVLPRMEVTGLMNLSLLSDFEGLHLARAAGLAAVANFPPLRRFALQTGLSSGKTLPFAMRATASHL